MKKINVKKTISLLFQTLIVKDSQGNFAYREIKKIREERFKPLSSKTVREIAYIVGNYHNIKNIQST